MEEQFERFWKAKPRRDGSNPKYMAFKKWKELMRLGYDAEKIISAAVQWCCREGERKKIGTEVVAQAKTWLHQRRFEDEEYTRSVSQIDYEAAARAAARLGIEWKH